jgi:putative transcriptional regulator
MNCRRESYRDSKGTGLAAILLDSSEQNKPAIEEGHLEQSRMDADRIRTLRQRMQLTQEDFAHLIGVTFSTVNRWENGKSTPNRIASRLLIGLEKKLKSQ